MMHRAFQGFIIGLIVSSAVGAQSTYKRACVHLPLADATLSGKISILPLYGPPNFGEDPLRDAREAVPVLVLRKPIEACDDSMGVIFAVVRGPTRHIHLDFNFKIDERLLTRGNVVVRGRLLPKLTANDLTRIHMLVRSVSRQRKDGTLVSVYQDSITWHNSHDY
jgi:hypothetical protein